MSELPTDAIRFHINTYGMTETRKSERSQVVLARMEENRANAEAQLQALLDENKQLRRDKADREEYLAYAGYPNQETNNE